MVLNDGLWVWLWDHDDGWAQLDASKLVGEFRAHGVTGVLPHGTGGMLSWLKRGALAKFRAAGIAVCPSLSWVRTSTILPALALDVGHLGGGRVMLDWEGWWDGQQPLARRIAAEVLAAVPDAAQRVTDCPWWAPLFYIDGAGRRRHTHPRAPTREFGVICAEDRYVQAYGAPHRGRSAEMLAWSRSPTQYEALGRWTIRPAHQLYKRDLQDVIRTTLAEPTQCLWDWSGSDATARRGLRVVAALRARHFDGRGAVRSFQAAAGLVVDDICGPRTLAALGVT